MNHSRLLWCIQVVCPSDHGSGIEGPRTVVEGLAGVLEGLRAVAKELAGVLEMPMRSSGSSL